jgi:PAS domain S-box-containing protein
VGAAPAVPPLPARIRWLRRGALAGVIGAVTLLLALVWALLPARLDPARAGSGGAGTSAASAARGEACAREIAALWAGWSAAQRSNDVNRQTLRDHARRCRDEGAGPVTVQLLDAAGGSLTLVVQPPAASGRGDDSGGTAAAVQRARWLLSALALGLVTLAIVSLRWPGLAQRAHRRDLEQQIRARQDKEAQLEQEVAARRGTALALQSEIAFREDIEESTGVGLRVIGRDGRLTYVNRAFCDTAGWPRETLIGQAPPYRYWPQDGSAEAARVAEHLRALLAGEARGEGYRVTFVRPDGSRWTAQVSARSLGSGEGWILASTDISREIDEQRRIEALNDELRRQSSVHLLGERAGELLHKISNHSGACVNALDGVQRHLQAGRAAQVAEGVRIAARAAQHMRDIVERFRPWLRDEAAVEPASLREIVADALAQESSYAAAQNVATHNGVSADLPALAVDRLALCEVLANLIRNAVWAMHDVPIANRQLGIESWADEERGQVQIHVRDRGPGVPAALRERIFERGYSTRSGGSGWGLYICRHWVEKLGGTLVVTDNLPRGADFVVTLPLRPPPEPADGTEPAS